MICILYRRTGLSLWPALPSFGKFCHLVGMLDCFCWDLGLLFEEMCGFLLLFLLFFPSLAPYFRKSFRLVWFGLEI